MIHRVLVTVHVLLALVHQVHVHQAVSRVLPVLHLALVQALLRLVQALRAHLALVQALLVHADFNKEVTTAKSK